MSFDIVRGNTQPPMDVDISGDATGADSVQLRWAKPDGTTYLSTLTAVTPAEGLYKMEWGPDDTDQIGPHIGEVVVTVGGEETTYPADGSKIIWWVNPSVADLVGAD